MADTSIVPKAGPGQPPKILKFGDKMIAFLEQGYPVSRSAELAGIAVRAHYNWYERGKLAQQLIDEGGNPDPSEYIYIKYFGQVNAAHNTRRLLLGNVVFSSAIGGETIKETRTVEVTDANGNPIRTEKVETVKELPRDWRAAAYYLKMMHREDWHTREDHTVTAGISPQDALAEALSGMDEDGRKIALRNLAIVAALSEGKTEAEAEAEIVGEFEEDAPVPSEAESEW